MAATVQMASASTCSLTNDEIKHRILSVYTKFVSDVEPDRLSDWLVQENVITIDEKQRIRNTNHTTTDRCRALLDHLLSIQHPRAFLVVRKALSEQNHYLLEYINDQGSGYEIRVQPNAETCLQERTKELENDLMLHRERDEHMNQRVHKMENNYARVVAETHQLQQEREVWCKEKEQLLRQDKEREVWCKEKDQLIKQIRELQQCLERKIVYKKDPVIIRKFKTESAETLDKRISGLAIVDNDLYVTTFHTNVIELYFLMGFKFRCSRKLDFLHNAYDLAYCRENNCLYVMDHSYRDTDTPTQITRVHRDTLKLLKSWMTGMSYGCISVAYDGNVLMAEYEGDKIIEYAPDGEIIRQLTLPVVANPRHAIKLIDGRYLVSHAEGKDPQHRVCTVNTRGEVCMSYFRQTGSTSDRPLVPIYLATDSAGSIFVVDRDNDRVLLLSSSLLLKSEIIPRNTEGMNRPERMAFDRVNGRLILAQGDSLCPSVFVFKIL